MSPVDLTSLLDACQGEKVDDWCLLPHFGSQTDLLVGVVNPGSLDEPLLTGTAPLYRALYVPDARLTLAYGVAEDADQPERREGPDWADESSEGHRAAARLCAARRRNDLVGPVRVHQSGRRRRRDIALAATTVRSGAATRPTGSRGLGHDSLGGRVRSAAQRPVAELPGFRL